MTDVTEHPYADRRVSREFVRPDLDRRRRRSAAGDDVLLGWARTGDADAFAELYRRHHRDALHFARHLACRSLGRDAADDIVAEAVRKILSAIRHGRGPLTGFRPYLFTVIRTVVVTAATRPGRVTLDSAQIPEVPLPGPEDDLTSSEALDALSSLPPRWQQVLWATSVTDLGHDQLAAMLGISARAVASVAMRARAALRLAFVRSHLPHPASRDCDSALDLVALLVVGTLEPSHEQSLEQHLDGCDSCRRARSNIDTEFASWPKPPASRRSATV